MDPITTAIVTAVSSGLAKDVIKDSYESLKTALKKKFGSESEIVEAVENRLKANYQPVKVAISLEPLGYSIEHNAFSS